MVFDIDTFSASMNYHPNNDVGLEETNDFAGTPEHVDAGKQDSGQYLVLPFISSISSTQKCSNDQAYIDELARLKK